MYKNYRVTEEIIKIKSEEFSKMLKYGNVVTNFCRKNLVVVNTESSMYILYDGMDLRLSS